MISYCADPALYVVIVRVPLPFSLQLLPQNNVLKGVSVHVLCVRVLHPTPNKHTQKQHVYVMLCTLSPIYAHTRIMLCTLSTIHTHTHAYIYMYAHVSTLNPRPTYMYTHCCMTLFSMYNMNIVIHDIVQCSCMLNSYFTLESCIQFL